MIAVVSRPAQRELREIACPDYHSARAVRKIHQNLGPLPRLCVFISYIMHCRILPDVPEMDADRLPDGHLRKAGPETLYQTDRVPVCAVSRPESRHRHRVNSATFHPQQIKRPRSDEQRQRGIQAA